MEITEKTEESSAGQTRKIIITGVILGLAFGFFSGRTMIHRGSKKVAVNTVATTTDKTTIAKGTDDVKKSPITIAAADIAPVKKITAPAYSGTDSISVADQNAGMSAYVKKATLSHDGWVAIRENIDGDLGNVLGAQWLPEGSATEMTVDLLRGTHAGEKYFAVLYKDNGDRRFSTKTDTLLENIKPASFIAQ